MILKRVVRGLTEKMTRTERSEGVTATDSWGKDISGKGTSQCWRSSKEVGLAGQSNGDSGGIF